MYFGKELLAVELLPSMKSFWICLHWQAVGSPQESLPSCLLLPSIVLHMGTCSCPSKSHLEHLPCHQDAQMGSVACYLEWVVLADLTSTADTSLARKRPFI